jgi:DNA-binding MarR family transcriptional regulator
LRRHDRTPEKCVAPKGGAPEKEPIMSVTLAPEIATSLLREVILSLVRRDGPALSAHQLGVYLTCYTVQRDHTVRGLAAELGVSKSVITRALDKLSELDLARRRPDPSDRRSVLVEHTDAGRKLLGEISSTAIGAAKSFRN